MTDERFFGRLGPVGTVPAAQSPDTLPDLAGSLNDLSVRLGEVGRRNWDQPDEGVWEPASGAMIELPQPL
jgi:hypothetical protein